MEREDAWHLTGDVTHEQGKGDPFAAAVRATRMPMIITDPRKQDNPIVFANDAFLELTGYERSEVLGRNCRFLQGEDTDPSAVARIRNAIEAGEDIKVELLNYRKDHTPFYNALYISPVYSAEGELQFFFASQFDVTKQTAAQEALRQREAELRLIVDGAKDYAILTVDAERNVTSWSSGAERAFGYSADDIIGQSADAIFTPQDRQDGVPHQEITTAANDGCAVDERWHQRSDGSAVFMNGSMHPLPRDEQGRDQGYIKIARDETERRRADDLLRENEEFTRRILASSADCIKVLDLDGRLEFMSEGGMCVMEVDNFEAVKGKCWTDFWPDEEQAKVRAAIGEAKDGESGRFQGFAKTMKGSPRWWDVIVSPISGPDGRPEKLLSVSRDVTAFRQAEAQSSELAERYRLAARATNDAIWDWRVADGHVTWNEALSELFGHEKIETDAQWWIDRIHPEDRARIDRDIHEVIEGAGQSWSAEYRFQRADGSYAYVFDRGHVLRNDAGEAIRVIGAMLDLTARKEAESKLVSANALLSAVMEAVPGVVYAKDRQGRMLTANRGTAELIGKSPADFIGQTDREFLDDRDQADAIMTNDQRIMAAGEMEVLEEDVSAADGTPLVWLSTKAPFYDEQGNVIGLVGASVDITQRKLAEEQLRELNDTLEAQVAKRTEERDRMWRLSTDIMLVAQFQGEIVAVNPAWTALFGWQKEDLIGRSFMEFVHEQDAESTRSAAASLAEGATIGRFENRYRAEDGSYRWISWAAVPGDGLIHAVGRDITAEKEQAEALSMAEEQLRQAQKMEAVGQLTGGIAHDFNNLLTGVIGSLDMMQRRIAKGETDRIERCATTAMTAANRAAALTHRLLAFARRQPLDPKPVNSNRLVTGMEELLRRTIGEAVSLEIVTAGGLWQTRCDPHQLESAILNLAINARDAMPEGGKLTIETCNARLDDAYAARQREVTPGQYVCICVTDTGCGMSPEVIEKVFEPFFTTKPIGQGTGLGLSMIYGFARQSEGYVKIYSEVGEGSTIKLYLPRYYGAAEETEDDQDQLTDEHRAEAGETVLVVEDEAAVRELVMDVLQELGYKAVHAIDGPSGLKILQSDIKLDLMISDVGLPGLNGRQLADAARKLRPDLKVLFMTGYAENATIANGFLDPGMQMITKPFAIEALATRIRDIIEEG
jgi:PAS domain S-box-containing protein